MDQALEDLVPGIVKPYVGWIVGMDWPEADEETIFKKVEALTTAGKGTDGVGTSGDITFAAVKACMDGVAADSFGKYWDQFTKADPQFLPNLTKACNQAAEQLHSYGLDVEYTKYMILFSLILLAFQIAYFIAMAAPSFGASLSLIPGACAITQMGVRQLAITLLRNILFSTAIMEGMDAGIQGIQMLEGNRKDWDFEKTKASIEGGVMTGIAFTGMAGLFSRMGGSRLASAAAQDLKFGELTGREKFATFMTNSWGGHMLQSGAANMLGSVPMLAASGQLDLEHLAKAGTSGLIGAADGHLIKPTATGPHGGPPPPGDLALPGAHPTATDAAHHPGLDGPPAMDPNRILSGDYKGPSGDGGGVVPAGDHIPPGEHDTGVNQPVSYDGGGQPVVPHQEGGQPHQTVAYDPGGAPVDPSHPAPHTALADAHTPGAGDAHGPLGAGGRPTQPFPPDGGTGGRPDPATRPRLDQEQPPVVPVTPPQGDGNVGPPGEGGRGSNQTPQRPEPTAAARPDQPAALRPDQAKDVRPGAQPQPGRGGEPSGGDGTPVRDGGGRASGTSGRSPDVVVAPVDLGPGAAGRTPHADAPRTVDQIRHAFREGFGETGYRRFVETFEHKLRLLPEDSPWREIYRRIPEELLAAVDAYTGGWHRDINTALREGSARLLAEHADHIEALKAALNRLPPHEGIVHRGVDLTPEQVARYQTGEVLREPAFTSATPSLYSRLRGNTHFVIESHNGRETGPLATRMGHEREVIFPPGTEFKVLGVDSRGAESIVYLREVDNRPAVADADSTKPFQILADQGLSGDGYAAPGHWGRYGSAGGLIRHTDAAGTHRYLVAQRGPGVRSNVGKWQLPGGALNSRETPAHGFAREISEELGVGPDYLDTLSLQDSHLAEGPNGWTYTSMAIDSPTMFDPRVDGTETSAAKWVTADELAGMVKNGELHPALAESLPDLLDLFHGHDTSPVAEHRAPDVAGPVGTSPATVHPDAATGSQPHRMEDYTRTGGRAGSNPGGTFVDPAGDGWYVKAPASDLHAKNEVLANDLYRLADVPVPRVELLDLNGNFGDKNLGLRSGIVDGVQDLPGRLEDLAHLAKIRENFAVDAWLANWDTVGLKYDNVLTTEHGPVRVDAGGSLLYRALGDPKGHLFTDHVGEIDSLRDPSMNPQAARVFKDVTDAEIQAGVAKIRQISEHQIREAVDRRDFPAREAAILKDRLIARRQDLIDRFGGPDAPAVSGHPSGSHHPDPAAASPHDATGAEGHHVSAGHDPLATYEDGLRHLGLHDLGPEFHSTAEDRQAIRDFFGEVRFDDLLHSMRDSQRALDSGRLGDYRHGDWAPILDRTPIEDQVALHYYTMDPELNAAMREGDLTGLEHWAPVIKGMVSALNEMPHHTGMVFRRIYLEPHQLHHLDVYQPGAVLREPSFISSSSEPKVKLGGNVEYVIESHTGRLVAPDVHARPQEREVIFTPDRHYRVLDVEDLPGGGKRIYMRELVDVTEPVPPTLRAADPPVEPAFTLHPGSHDPLGTVPQHAGAPSSKIADLLNGTHDEPSSHPPIEAGHDQSAAPPNAPRRQVMDELAERHGGETVDAAVSSVYSHSQGGWQKAYERVATEDLASSRLFAQSDHRPINEALYGGHQDALAPYAEQMRSHDTVLEELPPYEGPVHRMVDLEPTQQARYRPGEVVWEPGYVMASGNPHDQFHGNTEFVIESRTGRLVGPAITEHIMDHEVHFRRDTPFEVTSVEPLGGGRTRIHLRDLGDAPEAQGMGPHEEQPVGAHSAEHGRGAAAPSGSLERGIASGVADRRPLHNGSSGARVEHVTFNDGSSGVHTEFSTKLEADREYLALRAGEAAYAPVPRAVRDGETGIFTGHVEGTSAAERGLVNDPNLIHSDRGRLLGFFDTLIANGDRSGFNWLVTEHRGRFGPTDHQLSGGIDHRLAFADTVISPGHSPFAEPYVRREPNGRYTWTYSPIHRSDIALIRPRLEALRPEFAALGHPDWHDAMMGRFEKLALFASGERPLITDHRGRPPLAEGTGPADGGHPGEAAGHGPSGHGEQAPPPPSHDDFGPIDAKKYLKVPLAELRPMRTHTFENFVPLSSEDVSAMSAGHERVTQMLAEMPGGRPVTARDILRIVKELNPTGHRRNCPEAAMAVDDVLRGKPAVAGRLNGAIVPLARTTYKARAIESWPRLESVEQVESIISAAGPGARGIIIGHGGKATPHVYNIVNIDGRIYYLDGQEKRGWVGFHPVHDGRFTEYDLYRTG